MLPRIHRFLTDPDIWLKGLLLFVGVAVCDYGSRILYGHDDADPSILAQLNTFTENLFIGLILYNIGAARSQREALHREGFLSRRNTVNATDESEAELTIVIRR